MRRSPSESIDAVNPETKTKMETHRFDTSGKTTTTRNRATALKSTVATAKTTRYFLMMRTRRVFG